ncbi:MAG TPA: Uma2 family endonuclease [Thermoanaerobaculia bacterium]|nr:Uma2 family endonuclease [Thermoanaerobaculia bacterium]
MAVAATNRLTYEDYVKLPDDGNRYEIIDGELYVNPSPVPRHQFIVAALNAAFVNYSYVHGGKVAGSLDVVLADDRVVQPDVLFIKDERASIIGGKNIQGPPHIVVEVLSDGTRRYDEIQKRKLYESAGVDEYWVVDPELELVKIFRLQGGTYTKTAEIDTDAGGTITSPLLPGFELPITRVFA